jgi:hypothetical protein
MASTTPSSPTTEVLNEDPLLSNISNLRSIIKDITQKLHHQVIGNCNVLENIEIVRLTREGGEKLNAIDGQPIVIPVFCKTRVDALVRNPVRFALGRLNGLGRVLDKLEEQAKARTR